MACDLHAWWFDAACPTCSGMPVQRPDVTTPVIPDFLIRDKDNATPGEQRLWTHDNMEWVIAPHPAAVGETYTWAGKRYKVEAVPEGSLRVKMLK